MKRFLSLLLVLCLLLALTACGSSSSTTASDSESEAAQEESTEEVSEEASEEAEAEEAETETEEAAETTEESAEESETEQTEEAASEEESAEESTEESASGMTQEEQIAAVAALEIENPYSLPLTEDEVTLTMWSDFIPPLFNYMENGMADNLVYQTLQERTGITLDISSVAMDNAANQVSLLVASGDYPNLWYGFTSYYSNGIDEAVESGIIYNLADYKDQLPSFFQIIDGYDIYTKSAYTDEGNVGAFNGIWTNATIDGGLTIRQDWLDEQGLDTPVTLDDFYNVLTTFKNEYGATYYMSQDSGDPVNTFSQCFGVAGYAQSTAAYAYFTAENGETVTFSPLQDGFRDYLETMAQWYSEGLIYADFLSASDSMPSTDLLLNGEVGLTYYSVSNYTTLMSQVEEGDDFNLVAIDVPVNVETGEAGHLGRSVDYASAKGVSITTSLDDSSEEFELACELMDYLYTDEGSELCNYGVEGETFTYGDDGEHVWTDLMLNNPEGLAYSWCLNRYTLGAASFRIDSSRTMNEYGEGELALLDVWNNTDVDDANVLPSGISLTADESSDFTAVFSDIHTYVESSILSFITGTTDFSEYDTFVATIEEMGIQECIDILQDAVDRYNVR